METIAVIDDDVYIGNMIEEVLTNEGYGVLRAYSGTEALLLLEQKKPDLILLDLMLPGLSGEEVLANVTDIPVIVVSAKIDVQDKVHVLMKGACDYLTKPFDTQELLARVAVALRQRCGRSGDKNKVSSDGGARQGDPSVGMLRWGALELNESLHTARIEDRDVRLTKTEYAILKLLLLNPSQVITKSVMLDRISEDTPDCMESSLKVHVSNLRKKLREISGRDYIEAVWGIGFKLREEQTD